MGSALQDPTCTLWIDIDRSDDLTAFAGLFDLHPLAVEDALGHVEHPKIDDYGRYLYIVVHGLYCCESQEEPSIVELDIFLGPNYLLTYHHESLHCTAVLAERIERDPRLMERGADGLTHMAIDVLVDDLMPLVDQLDAALDALEEQVLAQPSQRTLARILAIKRATLHLRRTIVPQREVAYRLSRGDYAFVHAKTRAYFSDVYDHLVRLVDINESLRDLVASVMEMYLSATSNRMNEIMKVLTLVTTIFMPLTLVAGVYGMNFHHMPELTWRYGYFAVLGAMLVIAASMLLWFRRRGWM